MSPAVKLARMVVRIDPELSSALADLANRLFEETRIESSHAASIRELVAIGLASIADAVTLAPLFVGARIPRGRKPGTRLKTRTADARGDLDLEHEDEAEGEEGGER